MPLRANLNSSPDVSARRPSSRPRVLIFEPDQSLILAVERILFQAGYVCIGYQDVAAGLTAFRNSGADIIVADLEIAATGVDLLKRIRAACTDVPIILLASESAVNLAIAAMHQGVFDYVSKPPEENELTAVIARALEMGSLKRENRRLREQLDVASAAAGFIAESAQSKEILALVRRVAPARSTVMIEGESGTGKELVARLLHYWSSRADEPFVAINCKAFADGVVESELFGHEKGSFTGAISARAGCFERASGGTLFLDEIAEAGPDFQAKLLRVLEDGEVMRVGASHPRKVNVRIIAATNRVLRHEVKAGDFRADLFFRLNVIPIRIPPLRERPQDILPLARHFLAFHASETGRPLTLTADARQALIEYAWPGNIRELENAIERAVVISGKEDLTVDAFALEPPMSEAPGEAPETPEDLTDPTFFSKGTLQDCIDRVAFEQIKSAIVSAHGNRAAAANALGVDRTTLYRFMRRLGIK
ncbi:MAG: sigma-54-dependent transcriptional regulator [Candidatus Binataceae bacterium]